jgi:large repetitive protein
MPSLSNASVHQRKHVRCGGAPSCCSECARLVEVGTNYFLYAVGGSSGPELKYTGAPVVAGQFGSWAPIGAEQTASGYEVAWKVTGADQYTVWSTDSSGNYLSNIIGAVSGSSAALESLEPSFQQDLNGDGVIGPTTIAAGATVEIPLAYSGTLTFSGSTGTLKLDSSTTFTGKIGGQLAIGDVIDLADLTAGANATIGYTGNNSPGTLTVSDGTHTASIALLGNYSLANFTASSDGHGGTSVVDPPVACGSALYTARDPGGSQGGLNQQMDLLSQAVASFAPSDWGSSGGPKDAVLAYDPGQLTNFAQPSASQQHV